MTQVIMIDGLTRSVRCRRRKLTGLARKRCLWSDAGRNQLISLIAQMIVAHDAEAMRTIGLGVYLPARKKRSVVMLVESTEQARYLGELLPEWHIHHLSATTSARRAEPHTTKHRGTIVTLAHAFQHPVTPNVLIRATSDSGDCWWTLPPGVVIDFLDDFDRRASRDDQRRLSEYRDCGWPIAPLGVVVVSLEDV